MPRMVPAAVVGGGDHLGDRDVEPVPARLLGHDAPCAGSPRSSWWRSPRSRARPRGAPSGSTITRAPASPGRRSSRTPPGTSWRRGRGSRGRCSTGGSARRRARRPAASDGAATGTWLPGQELALLGLAAVDDDDQVVATHVGGVHQRVALGGGAVARDRPAGRPPLVEPGAQAVDGRAAARGEVVPQLAARAGPAASSSAITSLDAGVGLAALRCGSASSGWSRRGSRAARPGPARGRAARRPRATACAER